MVWSQFSIKILGVHFGSSVLDNSNWDKIIHCKFSWKRIVNQILLSKLWYIGQIYTIPKFIKENIEKTVAQLSIWKCGLGILDIDTQLNSLELKWV